MLQVSKLVAQGQGLAAALIRRAATVELDWDVRQKSRFDATVMHTHTFSFKEIPTAVKYARERIEDAIKVVIKVS